MPRFVLHLTTCEDLQAEGKDIAQACASVLGRDQLALIDSYHDENGRCVQVSTQAQCGCTYHAMDGLACEHDLEKAGIIAVRVDEILSRSRPDELY